MSDDTDSESDFKIHRKLLRRRHVRKEQMRREKRKNLKTGHPYSESAATVAKTEMARFCCSGRRTMASSVAFGWDTTSDSNNPRSWVSTAVRLNGVGNGALRHAPAPAARTSCRGSNSCQSAVPTAPPNEKHVEDIFSSATTTTTTAATKSKRRKTDTGSAVTHAS